MLELVVIADDLTGAADTSVQFCPFLKRVWLFPGDIPARVKHPAKAEAWGIHTDSRSLPPHQAYLRNKAVASNILEKEPALIYKKVDSCMRGNVGVEVQALLEILGKPCAFIAPAYPEMGRITLGGIHMVHGVPVAQSEMGRDPLNPVRSSKMEELAGDSGRIPAAHLDLGFVESPEEKLLGRVAELVSKGVRHISFDALEMKHLRKIAQAALKAGALAVGSAGLAAALAQVRFAAKGACPAKLSIAGLKRQLFVVGSKSEKARAQTNFLLAEPAVHHVTVPSIDLPSSEKPWKPPLAISSGCLILAPQVPQGTKPDPRQITQALAAAARQITECWSPQALFLTGGETAQAVLERLGIRRIRLLGELHRGVVVGKAQGALRQGLLVLTKAGAFGDEQVMVSVLRLLRQGIRPDEQEKGEGR